MPLSVNIGELTRLMEDFYVLTGMRIVLFDENYTELVSYPPKKESFCLCMRENSDFDKKCRDSDECAFCRCRETGDLYVYKCHAGLIEAVAPLTDNEKIIGYMMFGQVRDIKDKSVFTEKIKKLTEHYKTEGSLTELIGKIKYKSNRQILAASKILDACTGYVRLKDMVKLSKNGLAERIEKFIDRHISENLSIERLCKEFNISRSQLYLVLSSDGGIATHIRNKRLERAVMLLRTTDLSIADIAEQVGFSDYNYFLRVFKKKYGVSTKKYLSSLTENS